MTYRLVVVAAENAVLRDLPQQLGDSVHVQVFDSANEALWEVQSNPPEAVIAEVDLPDMSGLELAEIIPNFDARTRVVLWSAGPNEGARKQAEALGVYQFLQGSQALDTLRDTVQAAFREAEAIAASAAAAPPEPEPEPEPEPLPQPERREFTPARITLPSMREREQAAAAAAAAASSSAAPSATPSATPSRGGGLASRTRAAAERKPAPAARPVEPKVSPDADALAGLGLTRRAGANTLVVTAENINTIRSIMSQLSRDLGAQSIMLTDRAGLVMVEVGSADNMPMMTVLPLLSTSFSTAGEVARQLRENDATTVYVQEGASYDLYCFDVAQRFLLVLMFNKKVHSSKIGSVWIGAKRAVRDLRDTLTKT